MKQNQPRFSLLLTRTLSWTLSFLFRAVTRRFAELSDLMSETKNYALYRRNLADSLSQGRCIPFLGVFLTQVVQIESYIMLQSRMHRSRRSSRRASKQRMSMRRRASSTRNLRKAKILSRSAETLVIAPSSGQCSSTSTPLHHAVPSASQSEVVTPVHKFTPTVDLVCQSCCSPGRSCNCSHNRGCATEAISQPAPAEDVCDAKDGISCHTPDVSTPDEECAFAEKVADSSLATSPTASDELMAKSEGSTCEDSAYGSDGSTRANSLSHHSRENSSGGDRATNAAASRLAVPEIIVDVASVDEEVASTCNTPAMLEYNDSKKPTHQQHISQAQSASLQQERSDATSLQQESSDAASPQGSFPRLKGRLKAALASNPGKASLKLQEDEHAHRRSRSGSRANESSVDGGLEAAFSSLDEQLECYKKASRSYRHCSRPWVRYFLEHIDYNTEEKNYKLSLQREPKTPPQARNWRAVFGNR